MNTITLDSDIEIVLRASWPELSATERRCVFLALAYGLRNAVIADYLGTSEDVVKQLLWRVYNKTGTKSYRQAYMFLAIRFYQINSQYSSTQELVAAFKSGSLGAERKRKRSWPLKKSSPHK